MNKQLTIYDIAKLTGFSPKTVSRVINGGENVKKETYNKIMKLISEIGYTPNVYARNLSTKGIVNILISVKKVDAFPLIWFQTLLDKVLATCKENSVNAIVEYFGENDKISNSIISASGSLVDGVILFYEGKEDTRIEFLKKNNIPFIIFGKSNDDTNVYVSNDDYGALYNLLDVISSLQHKKIWMLMGNKNNVNKERVAGAKKYVKKYRDKNIQVAVFYDLTTIELIYQFISKKLINYDIPDVIFVSGDEKVQGLIKALNEKDIKIPGDVAIVGFDNIPISQYYTPALSTIAQDYQELANELVQGLLSLIGGKNISSIEVPTQLIRRETL